MKISEASELFLRTKEQEGFSPFTCRSYAIHHKQLKAYAGDVDVEDVTLQMFRDHVRDYGTCHKPASVQSKVRALKSLYSWLLDEEHITKNSAKKLHEPRDYVRIPKALSIEEMELLRDSCSTPFEHALVEFLFATGIRVGEAYRLNRSDIDFLDQSVIVLGKGNKQREVYFGARSAIWLKRYLETRTDTDPCLFATNRATHRMSIHHIQRTMKRISRRCGLDHKVTPHVLRHTFATTILDNGAPIHTVQNLMGHEKGETTLLYIKMSGEQRKQAYNRYFMQ